MNYADELGKVPKRFRSKGIIVDVQATPVEVIEGADNAKDVKKGTSPDRPEDAAGKSERAKVLYGGKDEESWRKGFAKAKADIKAVEEFIVETKARLKDTDNMSRTEYLSLQNTVKDSEIRLNGLRNKLEALTEAANKANVPMEIR